MFQKLLKEWKRSPGFQHMLKGMEKGYRGQLISGLEGSQRSFLIGGIRYFTKRPILIVTTNQGKAEKIYHDLKIFIPQDGLFLFPNRDFFYSEEILTQSKELMEQRLMVLERICTGRGLVVIAPIASLLTKMTPHKLWEQYILKLSIGQAFNREKLIRFLVEQGYERAVMIDRKGQFSVRGEIVDIFPYSYDNPLRVEFFDEEIESIRSFDVINQRSIDRFDRAVVIPAGEIVVPAEQREMCVKKITEELARVTGKLRSKSQEATADRLKTKIQRRIQKIYNIYSSAGLEFFLPYFYEETDTLFDYFPKDTVIIVDELERLEEAAHSFLKDFREHQSTLIIQGEILPSQVNIFWEFKDIFEKTRNQVVCFNLFPRRTTAIKIDNQINIESKIAPSFQGKWELAREEIRDWWQNDYRLLLLARSKERGKGLIETIRDYSIPVVYGLSQGLPENMVSIEVGNLENGFLLPELNMVILTEDNLLPKKVRRRHAGTSKGTIRLRDYQDLEIGDYVVHEQHGIGRYLGIRTLDINKINKDFLHVQYTGEDKLFIPTDQIDIIQKYVGAEGHKPKLNRLGGQEWNRAKSKVKVSVEELARDLLSLYAARESVTGYAFSPDYPWQREFEEFFPFEETPDQVRVIEEVKADMEKSRPMDRLLCGDVGYGKTEVALRAAFKAIMDNKQVAFLVPTTILAQQHYNNFVERFKEFPINIGLLSRFKGVSEQKETINGLRDGTVDIVIGTHRLLSSDVKFKDLGLLVIDEEQRFGVRQKEKLKKLRLSVDVLAMTATPIPRTLHLSLAGGRDLSVIETPPEERYPIQTYVVEYSDTLIYNAIKRELNRNGQVYFVYNRVQTIDQWAIKIKELIPEARIAIAHGQMPETRLEKVMSDFLEKRYDILISTTIVEAGLDIPNVNTMIINDADKFGLAQLYQLRGRVGRSNRLAYSYLTYRRDKILSPEAEKRLQAIKDFTELGSGFKIALRDLEIRGAGNILGPEQHGFMMTVGFSLYCQLLEEAISKVKGELKPEKVEPKVELNVDAFLPEGYIPNQQQKIDIYQRIASLESEEEVTEIEMELRDRFGSPPHMVLNLLSVARLRIMAKTLNVESIRHEQGQIVIKFGSQKKFDGERLWKLAERYRGKLRLQAGKNIAFKIKTERRQIQSLEMVEQILGDVREVAN